MKIFKDAHGREWALQVNYSAKQRVQAATGIDLFDLSVFQRIGNDPAMLIDVLRAVCDEQIEKAGIAPEAFMNGLVGDPIEVAGSALIDEIIAFFPSRRREALKKVLATASKVQDKALELLEAKLNDDQLLRRLQQSLTDGSGSSPASLASTPGPLPSASST